MNKIKLILCSLPVFFFTTNCSGSSAQPITSAHPITRESYKEILANPPQNQTRLNIGTFHGCVLVPATKSFIRKIMLGFESTGESCSVTVSAGNNVEVSFIRNVVTSVIPVMGPNQYPTDTLMGELANDQVLIVQYSQQGNVTSITQTIYDNNGHVVYGVSGKGDSIKSCHIGYGNRGGSGIAGPQNCRK